MKKISLLIIFLNCVWLMACTSNPTPGDKMFEAAQHTQQLGKQWNQGSELIKSGTATQKEGQNQIIKGEKLISEGRGNIKEGHNLIADGQRQVRQGLEMKNKSEANFSQHFATNPNEE